MITNKVRCRLIPTTKFEQYQKEGVEFVAHTVIYLSVKGKAEREVPLFHLLRIILIIFRLCREHTVIIYYDRNIVVAAGHPILCKYVCTNLCNMVFLISQQNKKSF
jgi:hypothetical protein